MKSIKYFFLAIIAFAGCAGYSQKTSDIVKIEFTSLTRGYNRQIVVTADSITTTTSAGRGGEMRAQKKKLSGKDWERVIVSVQGVVISEISDLKSPTEKRMFDGAKHSTITIITNGTSVSHSFDDEQPNEKLQKLMKELIKLEKSIN